MLHFSTCLSSMFTHLNIGRTDWKKTHNQCRGYSLRRLAVLFLSSHAVHPKLPLLWLLCKQGAGCWCWSSLPSPTHSPVCRTACQCSPAHAVLKGYRGNPQQTETAFLHPQMRLIQTLESVRHSSGLHLLNNKKTLTLPSAELLRSTSV